MLYLYIVLASVAVLIVLFFIMSVIGGFLLFRLLTSPSHFSRKRKTVRSTFYENEQRALEEHGSWIKTAKYSEHSIVTSTYLRSYGYFYEQPNLTHKWVIMSHGFNQSHFSLLGIASVLYANGYNLLLLDLKAHGKSEGKYSSLGHYDHKDIIRWVFQIVKKDHHAQIALFGQSMGASASLKCGGEILERNVKCIISDSGYVNLKKILKQQIKKETHVPLFPFFTTASWWNHFKLDFYYGKASIKSAISRGKLPILVIQGEEDEMIEKDAAQQIYGFASGEKELLLIKGAAHIKCHQVEPKLYYSTVLNFLDRYLK